METKRPEELIQLWTREEITIETLVGPILQNLAKLHTALEANTLTLYHLRSDVDSLTVRIEAQLGDSK